MRVINSLRNSAMTVLQMILSTVLGFVTRTIFIQTLGNNYNGLNSLFTSILSMLSIAELGIGTAIIFNLYRYIADGDQETIKSLMRYYRNCYRLVSGLIFGLGLLLLPFLSFFSDYQGIKESSQLIFLLFLLNTVVSYLFTYKRSILYADQKNYVISLIDSVYMIILNVIEIGLLIFTHNFIFYLLSSIILSVLENFLINSFINRQYPWLAMGSVKKLNSQIVAGLKKQIYGMLYHKIGSFIVIGTDSIIISKFLGLTTTGLYANYILVTNSLQKLLASALGGVTASVGHLLTEENTEKSFETYQNISLITFWLYSFVSTGVFLVMRPFISIWLGSDNLLSTFVLLVIVLNFYVQGMRSPIQIFQNAAGIFYENRHVPLIESVVNLFVSLILVHFWGLAGVLIGTLVSTIILYAYSFPKYIFSPIFKRKNSEYVLEQFRYLVYFSIILGLSTLASTLFEGLLVPKLWLQFLSNLVLSLLIPNLLLFLIYRKSSSFNHLKKLFFNLVLNKFH